MVVHLVDSLAAYFFIINHFQLLKKAKSHFLKNQGVDMLAFLFWIKVNVFVCFMSAAVNKTIKTVKYTFKIKQ